ncbi:MAG: type II toxin-antitoxin system RelE family toxin [Anaerolineae bacterium]|jgi:mRNA interferase RelE/StbE
MYQVRILEAAARQLASLDPAVARRIVKRVRWLAQNLEEIQLEALAGDLAGLYKLRIGDYRVIYEILHADQIIVIHLIGHRREIYRRP